MIPMDCGWRLRSNATATAEMTASASEIQARATSQSGMTAYPWVWSSCDLMHTMTHYREPSFLVLAKPADACPAFSEASDFEEPDLNLTSIQEHDGTSILCVNNACTDEDLRKMGHFAGGGVGG
jgi:hypothetical protein